MIHDDPLTFIKDYVRHYEENMGPIKECECAKFRCRARMILTRLGIYQPTEKKVYKPPQIEMQRSPERRKKLKAHNN